LKFVPNLHIYADYATNHCTTIRTMIELDKKRPQLMTFLQEIQNTERVLDLMSLLIQPIQRIPRYRLLLQDLIKCTYATHEDYKPLKVALKKIKKIANEVNETVRRSEDFLKLTEIKRVFGSPDELSGFVVEGRKFHYQGMLSKVCRKDIKRRYFYLLSDRLLYGAPTPSYRDGEKPHSGSLTYHNNLPLEGMKAIDLPDNDQYKNAFQIRSVKKSFVVVCSAVQEKTKWLAVFNSLLLVPDDDDSDGETAPVWYADRESGDCMRCGKAFGSVVSLTNRRHHCRKCGYLVCAKCSAQKAVIPSLGTPTPKRVCLPCYSVLKKDKLSNSRDTAVTQNGAYSSPGRANRKSVPSAYQPQDGRDSPDRGRSLTVSGPSTTPTSAEPHSLRSSGPASSKYGSLSKKTGSPSVKTRKKSASLLKVGSLMKKARKSKSTGDMHSPFKFDDKTLKNLSEISQQDPDAIIETEDPEETSSDSLSSGKKKKRGTLIDPKTGKVKKKRSFRGMTRSRKGDKIRRKTMSQGEQPPEVAEMFKPARSNTTFAPLGASLSSMSPLDPSAETSDKSDSRSDSLSGPLTPIQKTVSLPPPATKPPIPEDSPKDPLKARGELHKRRPIPLLKRGSGPLMHRRSASLSFNSLSHTPAHEKTETHVRRQSLSMDFTKMLEESSVEKNSSGESYVFIPGKRMSKPPIPLDKIPPKPQYAPPSAPKSRKATSLKKMPAPPDPTDENPIVSHTAETRPFSRPKSSPPPKPKAARPKRRRKKVSQAPNGTNKFQAKFLRSTGKRRRRNSIKKITHNVKKPISTVRTEEESVVWAIRRGDLSSVKEWIDLDGGNVNDVLKSTNQFQRTCLHLAAQHGKPDIIEFLLSQGADINKQDGLGATPLFVAVDSTQEKVVELLCAKGARQDLKGRHGKTAYDRAKSSSTASLKEIMERYQ